MSVFSSRTAQRRRLLLALRNAPVSTITARKELDIMHPAGRIKELREQGFDIQTLWQWQPTDSGKPHRVGLYCLISEVGAAND